MENDGKTSKKRLRSVDFRHFPHGFNENLLNSTKSSGMTARKLARRPFCRLRRHHRGNQPHQRFEERRGEVHHLAAAQTHLLRAYYEPTYKGKELTGARHRLFVEEKAIEPEIKAVYV